MKTQLEEAKKQGVTVIPVSHHNLLDESTLYPEECTIENTKEVTALLEAYGVPVYLSGHLHLQKSRKHTSNLNTPGGYGIREIAVRLLRFRWRRASTVSKLADGWQSVLPYKKGRHSRLGAALQGKKKIFSILMLMRISFW